MSSVTALIQREFWENHGALVLTPKIVVLLLGLCFVVFGIYAHFMGQQMMHLNDSAGDIHWWGVEQNSLETREFEYQDKVIGTIDIPENDVVETQEFLDGERGELGSMVGPVPYWVMWAIMFIVLETYALASLCSDKRDKSILFWKSLPVSESHNVLAKFIVAVFLIPAIAWLSAFTLNLVMLILSFVLAVFSGVDGAVGWVWSQSALVSVAWQQLAALMVASLWLLPITAWLMFVSSVVTRVPFVFAVIPLVLIIVVESIGFKSAYFAQLMGDYVLGMLPQNDNSLFFRPGWGLFMELLTSVKFWLGSCFAGMMVGASIWFRNNRFDQ